MQVRLVLGEELQNTVPSHELAGNPVSHRRRRVDEADAFVPRLQALRDVVHDDIVQRVAAPVIEGANLVADLEPKLRDVRCSQAHGAPARRTQQAYLRRLEQPERHRIDAPTSTTVPSTPVTAGWPPSRLRASWGSSSAWTRRRWN